MPYQVTPSVVSTGFGCPDELTNHPQDSRFCSASAIAPSLASNPSSTWESVESLTPVELIFGQLSLKAKWREAASTVLTLMGESALAGGLGWLTNYIFSLGNFVSGKPPQDQSYASFCAGIMGTTSFVLGISMLVAQGTSLAQFHFLDNPARHPTLGACVFRLLRRTGVTYIVSFVLVTTSAYALASLPPSLRWLKMHFYGSGIFVNLYTVNLDLQYRKIYRLETTEGQVRPSRGYDSYWMALLQLTLKDSLLLGTVYVAGVYVHLSTALELGTSTALLIFSVTSYGFKLFMQEITKKIMIYQKKTHVRTMYLAVAVPTVLIDTQIRVTILRQPNVKQSIAGSIALSVVEILFRFVKVWLIRLEISMRKSKILREVSRGTASSRPTHENIGPREQLRVENATTLPSSQGSQRPADIQSTDGTIPNHQQYIEFLQWRRRLLRFHAAEIHADMYAEYLAIVCSISIYHFFHAHPKYMWSTTPSTNALESISLSGGRQQVTYLVLQIVMEMLVDLLSCLWELANGVPLQNFKQMRGFVTALFACCAVTNIVLSATMSIASTGE